MPSIHRPTQVRLEAEALRIQVAVALAFKWRRCDEAFHSEIRLDGKDYFIMKEDDVLAVIEGSEKKKKK